MYLKESRKGFMGGFEGRKRRDVIISKIKINLKINNNKNKKFFPEECIGTASFPVCQEVASGPSDPNQPTHKTKNTKIKPN